MDNQQRTNSIQEPLKEVVRQGIWACMLLLMSFSAYSQDYLADVKNMQEAYNKVENLHSKVSIKVYDHKGAAQPVVTQDLELWKKGEHTYYNTGGLIMVIGKKYTLWINESEQKIAAQRNGKKKKEKGLAETLSPELEAAMNEMGNVEYIGKVAGLKHYRLFQKQGEIAQADIFINSQGYLQRMEYLYRASGDEPQHFVTVDFELFNTKANPKESLFEEGSYITEKGGKLYATTPYASYQVIMTKNEIDEK